MQFHIGAMRNNNTNKFNELGPNTGFDSMNDCRIAEKLAGLLDSLERDNVLPKTVLYTLNPSYNYVISSMLGNFQGLIPGKIQFGPAWWFNDNKDGMEEQMKALSNCGLLTRFIGMATDSRSFLSYARHEYFRRIVCNLIGKWVENGEVPCDMNYLGRVVQDISFNNARNYFEI
jgi:glucuronate isomerase